MELEWSQVILIIMPFLVIELGIRIYAIIDIHKSTRRVLLISKNAWTAIVAVVTLGWVVYLLFGREQ